MPTAPPATRRSIPLGLAFENFDAIGRWRTEEVTDGVGANPKVDCRWHLPDGRSYQTADEFKKLLLGDLDAFNHTFIEKLATYGLRRSMSFSDRDDLESHRRREQGQGLPGERHRHRPRYLRPVPETLNTDPRHTMSNLQLEPTGESAAARPCAESAPPSPCHCSMPCCRPAHVPPQGR